MKRKYTWTRDSLDRRDQHYMVVHDPKLPASQNLQPTCPPVYDQGELGSCTANAIGACMEFDLKKAGHDVMLSRLFIYYNERVLEHTVKSDAGGQIRDGIKGATKYGAPPESEWPYSDADPGPFSTKPSAQAYKDGLKHIITGYQRLPRTLATFKTCLYQGYPFAFGFQVYESFESDDVAKTGIVNLPAHHEELLGGHAVVAVGYDDVSQRFTVRNSWGTGWGQAGYFTMPYAYLLDTDLSDDFWTIRALKV